MPIRRISASNIEREAMNQAFFPPSGNNKLSVVLPQHTDFNT